MALIYILSKFLHIVGAILWIGGVVAVSILNARLVRERDPALLGAMARQSAFFGKSVAGPAAGVTLIAGIVMVAVGRIGFPFWIIWGLLAMVISGAIGSSVLQRAGQELGRRLEAVEPDDAAITSLQKRLDRFSMINILLLISAVWAMVFRPTL